MSVLVQMVKEQVEQNVPSSLISVILATLDFISVEPSNVSVTFII